MWVKDVFWFLVAVGFIVLMLYIVAQTPASVKALVSNKMVGL